MDSLYEVCTKIAKGLEYKINSKRYIEEPFTLSVLHGERFNLDLTKDPDGLLKSLNLGSEFEAHRIAHPNGVEVLYRVRLFDQYTFYVFITDKPVGESRVGISDGIINL